MSDESAPVTGQDQQTAEQPQPQTLAAVRAKARAESVELAARLVAEPAPAEATVPAEPASVPEPAASPELEAAPPQPIADETGRLHDPLTGQYVEKPQEPAEPEATIEPSDGQEAAEGGEAAVEEPAAPPVRDGFVRLDLPDKHPLRDRGTAYLDVPLEREQEFRHLVNTPIRRAEVERAEAEAKRARDLYERARSENAQLRARLEIVESGGDSLADPQVRRLYEDIKETYGEEQAELFKAGLDAKRNEQVRAREQELLSATQWEGIAQKFMQDVGAGIRTRYPIWEQSGELTQTVVVRQPDGKTVRGVEPSPKVTAVLERFAARVDAGTAEPTAEEFFRMLDIEYVLDPRVKAQVAAYNEQKLKREREQAAKDALAKAKAEEEARLKDAATRRVANPHRGLATVQTGTPSTTPPESDFTGMTPGQVRRQLREEVRRLAGGK